MVIRGLAGDDDVVDVAFAAAGPADADELGLLLEFGNAAAAAVTHAGAQAADQLGDDHGEGAAIGDASLDAFGNKLGEAVAIVFLHGDGEGRVGVGALIIAFTGAGGHGGQRSYAAIGFESAALVEDSFAGAFV